MVDKLRVISTGGKEEKIPDKIHRIFDIRHITKGGAFPPTAGDYKAVIIIARFIDTIHRNNAKNWALSNGLPCITAMKWNYVVDEMLKNDIMRPQIEPLIAGKDIAVVGEPDAPEEAASEPEVSEPELWSAFGHNLKSSVRSLLKPDDAMHVDSFIDMVAEDIGLSAEKTKLLLPRLHAAGILQNTVGDTWVLSPQGTNYEYKVMVEEAPKPVADPDTHARKIIGLMKGLGPGPYASQYAIQTAMLDHAEFVTRSGEPMGRTQAWRYFKRAMEEGVVFEQDGALYIVPDDSVKLTKIEKVEPEEKPKPKIAERPVGPMPVEPAPEPTPEPIRVSDDVKFLRGIVGRIDVNYERIDSIVGIKSLIPMAPWDKFADMTIRRILQKKNVSPRSIPKEMFSPEEWDWLAWMSVKEFKVEHLAPHMHVCFSDEHHKCVECASEFTFTKGEQRFYYQKNLTPPKRCPDCRQAKVPAANGGA